MTMTLTLLFITFGIPILTTVLISGYELLNYCLKPSKKPHIPEGFHHPLDSRPV